MQFKKNFLTLLSAIDGETVKQRDVARIVQTFMEKTPHGGKGRGAQWKIEIRRGKDHSYWFPLPDRAKLNHRDYNQRQLLERLKEDFSIEPIRYIPPHLLAEVYPLVLEEYKAIAELCDASPFAAEVFREADEAGADLRSFAVLRTLTGIFRAHATTIAEHGKTELSEQIEQYAQAYIEGIRKPPRQYNNLIGRALTARTAAAYGSLDPALHGTALAIVHHNPRASSNWRQSLMGYSRALYYGTNGAPFVLWLAFHHIDPDNVQPRTRRKPPTTTRKGAAERRREILARAIMVKTCELAGYAIHIPTIDQTVEKLGEAAIVHCSEYTAKADQRDGRNHWGSLEFFHDHQAKLISELEN